MSYKRGDHFTKRAQREGYAARSVYKLQEMHKKWNLLAKGQRVLDLGCAPGSWSRFAHEQIGFGGTLVGIDIQEVAGFPGLFLQTSIEAVQVEDMAPNTMGNKFTDHLRQIALIEAGRDLALSVLKPGGHFVAKIFEGREAQAFVQSLRAEFKTVKRIKPKATRDRSVEFFVAAMGKKS
jgi:23S rRNA (uridine2552-2'-O)-methyltransferase